MKKRTHSVRERLSDRMFDSGGFHSHSNGVDTARRPHLSSPGTQIREHQDFLELDLAVPGYHKEDLTVEVQNHLLTVIARPASTVTEGTHAPGFTRTFELDDQFDPKKVEATLQGGLLSIRIFNKNGRISLAPAKINVPIH